MQNLDINMAGLTVGMSYDVQTSSGRLFRRVVFIAESAWNNRPVLCFATAWGDKNVQINPSYIESIMESVINVKRPLNEERDYKNELTADTFDDIAAQNGDKYAGA